jgi:hypothetical protein
MDLKNGPVQIDNNDLTGLITITLAWTSRTAPSSVPTS